MSGYWSKIVYTFSEADLPGRNPDSALVRFGSVTPKQRFEGATHEDVALAIADAILVHETRAAEHLAAAQWLVTEAPTHVVPERVTHTERRSVYLPLDHEYLTPADFPLAMQFAGVLGGGRNVYPSKADCYGKAGWTTEDGRTVYHFEVTYTWQEVKDG